MARGELFMFWRSKWHARRKMLCGTHERQSNWQQQQIFFLLARSVAEREFIGLGRGEENSLCSAPIVCHHPLTLAHPWSMNFGSRGEERKLNLAPVEAQQMSLVA
jgi:hypothetical protein